MRKIEIEELQVGDEIIISGNSKLKYLKVLKVPVVKSNNGWKKYIDENGELKYRKDAPVYSSVRCSTRQDSIPMYSKWRNNYVMKEFVYEPDIEKHNVRHNFCLSNRDIILVKRENP